MVLGVAQGQIGGSSGSAKERFHQEKVNIHSFHFSQNTWGINRHLTLVRRMAGSTTIVIVCVMIVLL